MYTDIKGDQICHGTVAGRKESETRRLGRGRRRHALYQRGTHGLLKPVMQYVRKDLGYLTTEECQFCIQLALVLGSKKRCRGTKKGGRDLLAQSKN